MDIRQAWRKKFALNLLIWFICRCAVFVIAVFGAGVTFFYAQSKQRLYFDLSKFTQAHQHVVAVVPSKSILNYAGEAFFEFKYVKYDDVTRS